MNPFLVKRLLFKEMLGKEYSERDYIDQFTLRVPENLAKIDRITKIYETEIHHAPQYSLKY